jgi:Domain of unknown function (DUF5615)
MADLYANENMPLQVVDSLRLLGHNVLTTFESGRADKAIPDEDVLAFAADHDRVLITLNRKHFIRLHQQHPDHAGIIVCTFDIDYAGLAQRIHAALAAEPAMMGKLTRVNRSG